LSRDKLNNIRTGLVLGIAVPATAFLVLYLAAFRGLSPGDFLETLLERQKLSSVISLSVIPNLLLFFIFIWLDYLYSARGVLAATLLIALVVVISKYL
jgi:hypothetical protein